MKHISVGDIVTFYNCQGCLNYDGQKCIILLTSQTGINEIFSGIMLTERPCHQYRVGHKFLNNLYSSQLRKI